MFKKILAVLGSLLLILGLWFLFDYFHYSPPNMSDKQIKAAAVKELRPQAKKIVDQYTGWKDPGVTTEVRGIDILKVGKIRGKTYLIYRMDYKMRMTPAAVARMGGQVDNMEYYLLGLRLAEKGLTGIKLKPGMEFAGSYMDAMPVDCGHHPDGIFYAYCKDPQITSLKLESNDGRQYSATVKGRTVLMAVPPGKEDLYPRFYGKDGEEIIPNTVLRVAFVCGQPKAYQPYNNISAQWWPIMAADLLNLSAESVDAIWIFPDQLPAVRSPKMAGKLQKLTKDGVQLIFVGWKDPQDITRLLPGSHLGKLGQADSIEAVYATADDRGSIRVGSIGLDEKGTSPLLNKTMRLRFQIADDPSQKAGVTKPTGQASGSSVTVRKTVSPTVNPVPIKSKGVRP